MPDVPCPRCHETRRQMHIWRVDMVQLQTIDEYKCLACGERWKRTQPARFPIDR